MKKTGKTIALILALMILTLYTSTGCGKTATAPEDEPEKRFIVDQVGRKVELPEKIERVATSHHFDTKLIYALGQEDKMTHKRISAKEGEAMERLDATYAALPDLEAPEYQKASAEALMVVKPQVVFSYAAFDTAEIEQYTNAGLTVVGVKGETLDDTYEAIQLMGDILDCKKQADDFETYVKEKVSTIEGRAKDVKDEGKPKVLFTGPKSIYTVATGDMFQSEMIEMAGGINVSKELKGRWCEVSPEQIVAWNPDYIFLGSSFGTGTVDDLLKDPALSTVNAIKNKNVFIFPSNIGWWNFPLPQSILGIMWIGKTVLPEKYEDIDMTEIADEYYNRAFGYSFTEMGGKL
ncbi:MAG: ABC transporter substrate-binding protein [Clostridiales bacterium]|nr:ABC transporter substrate-binding protein [Clostridiales bacterium]